MSKAKPEYPTTKTPTWVPPSGFELDILITAQTAVLWKQQGKHS